MQENTSFSGEIYVHTNRVNGKSYVGQTTQGTEKRWRLHLRCARSKKTPAYRNLFSKAIRKYGKEAFESQVLSRASSQSELDNLEKVWIVLLQSKAPSGYNLTDGGDSGTAGHTVSPEVRERLSAATKAQWADPEFRELYSKLRRGKTMAPAAQEVRLAALRAALRGKKQSAETIAKRIAKTTGMKRSPEVCAKFSASHKGLKWSEARRNAFELARRAGKGKELNA